MQTEVAHAVKRHRAAQRHTELRGMTMDRGRTVQRVPPEPSRGPDMNMDSDTSPAHVDQPSTRWETIMGIIANAVHHEAWNKGKIVGQKAPVKLKDIWALRVRRQMEHRVRELAPFNLGIDSKLRGCDPVSLKVRDICHAEHGC
jgi:hypothetical protein